METIVKEIKCKKCKAFIGTVSGSDKKRVKEEAGKMPKDCPGGCKENE